MTDLRLVQHPALELVPRDVWPATLRTTQVEGLTHALTNRSRRGSSILVDTTSADLLQIFGRPTAITAAVEELASTSGVDPFALLEQAVPWLERLIELGHLVVVGEPTASDTSDDLPADVVRDGWSVTRTVRRIDDSAVYEVARQGERAALKIVRDSSSWALPALRNEAYVLGRTTCSCVPRVLSVGLGDQPPHLLVQWRDGTHVTDVAARLRRAQQPRSRLALLVLIAATARAYAQLHAVGVLHGDVQPRNVLATEDSDPAVSIVDLGFGDVVGDDAPDRPRRPRGGVEGYQAPELVHDGTTTWEATPASEQYALGCLLYELATGAFPFDRAVGAQEFRRRIGRVPPRPFVDAGTRGWEDLEAILARAMARSPGDRYPSVAELADDLDHLVDVGRTLVAPRTPGALAEPTAWVPPDELGRLMPPLASVNYGAAGIAWSLRQRARAQRDGVLLASAQAWVDRANALAEHPHGFANPLLGIGPGTVGGASLYHSPVGTRLVELLVARDLDEDWSAPLASLLALMAVPTDDADIVSGRAGHLLACCHALAALRDAGGRHLTELLRLGDQLLTGLAEPAPQTTDAVPGVGAAFLGMAHGWAGVAYAAALWCRLRQRPLPPWGVRLVDGLVAAAVDDGHGGACWPRNPGGRPSSAWAGWCHGSAGHALLHAELSRSLDPRHLDLAEAAGRHAASSLGENVSLCCGLAGVGYAALSLYRRTGREAWVTVASQCVERADGLPVDVAMQHSLYKGDLGIRLLRADLAAPSGAVFPLVEADEPRTVRRED
jgi:serine/threonine protein kinase